MHALGADERAEGGEGTFDLLVELFVRDVHETRRDAGDELFEFDAVAQGLLRLAAIGRIDRHRDEIGDRAGEVLLLDRPRPLRTGVLEADDADHLSEAADRRGDRRRPLRAADEGFNFPRVLLQFTHHALKGRAFGLQPLKERPLRLLPRRDFFALLEQHPSLVRGLLHGMTQRLVELTNRVAQLSGGKVEARLARLFLKLADGSGRSERGGIFVPLALSRQELADMTGTTIETCIRLMSRWGKERIIETGLVDGTNLLVMDMDLCVRCGNCSLACHKIHGQSRLTRRGIHVTRLEAPRLSAHQSALSPEVCMPSCLPPLGRSSTPSGVRS